MATKRREEFRKGDEKTDEKSEEKVVKRFDGVYGAPIDKIGPVGRWLRHMLLDAIVVGTPVLVAVQKYRTPWRDRIMHFLSFLGTEDFYTPLIVVICWVVDVRLGRLFTLLMSIGFYLASYGKNLLRLPRPPSPPVQVLENAYDWAMPSLHSILGVVLPWYIWIYAYVHYHLTFQGLCVLFCIIAFWSFSVMFSRVYLGVHSPADIVVGGIIGVLLLSLFVQIDDFIDHFIGYGDNVILHSFIFTVVFLAIHPRSDPPTMSFTDSVITASVGFGIVVARYRTVGQHTICSALLEHVPVNTNSYVLAMIAVTRVLIGFPSVLACRYIVKATVKSALLNFCNLCNIPAYSHGDFYKATTKLNKHYCPEFKLPPVNPPKSKREKLEKEEESDSEEPREDQEEITPIVNKEESAPFDIDIPTKFVTYTVMTWAAAEWCHYGFHYLNLTV